MSSTDRPGAPARARRARPFLPGGCLLALLLAGCTTVDVDSPTSREAARARAERLAREVGPEAQARYLEGLSAAREGREEAALERFAVLSREHPNLAGPPANAGVQHARVGRWPEAEAALREAIRRNPVRAAYHNQLGIVLRAQGRFREARTAYEQALALEPRYPTARLNLAILLDVYLDEPSLALPYVEEYLRLTGGDPEVEKGLPDLRRRAGPPR